MKSLKLTLVLLPTEDTVTLTLGKNGMLINTAFPNGAIQNRNNDFQNQHLYLTSIREIREGDWCFHKHSNRIVKADYDIIKHPETSRIEFTTDPTLIKDGVGAVPEKCLIDVPGAKYADQEVLFLSEFVSRYNNKSEVKIDSDKRFSFEDMRNELVKFGKWYQLDESLRENKELWTNIVDRYLKKPSFAPKHEEIEIFCEMEEYEYSDRASDSISHDNINYDTRIKLINNQPVIHFK